MKFKLGEKKILYKGKFITLWSRDFLDKSGALQTWEYAEKFDVIAVLPVTDDNKIILVKNYRVPLEKYVIEVPAGLADKKGETYEAAVERELREETGYAATKFYPLPPWPYRSGTSENVMYGYIATGLKKVTNDAGDATEDITVMEVPAEKLMEFWLHPEKDVLFQPEILAMYQAALELGIIKLR